LIKVICKKNSSTTVFFSEILISSFLMLQSLFMISLKRNKMLHVNETHLWCWFMLTK